MQIPTGPALWSKDTGPARIHTGKMFRNLSERSFDIKNEREKVPAKFELTTVDSKTGVKTVRTLKDLKFLFEAPGKKGQVTQRDINGAMILMATLE